MELVFVGIALAASMLPRHFYGPSALIIKILEYQIDLKFSRTKCGW